MLRLRDTNYIHCQISGFIMIEVTVTATAGTDLSSLKYLQCRTCSYSIRQQIILSMQLKYSQYVEV